MDLSSYHRSRSLEAIARARGRPNVVPMSSGIATGVFAQQIERRETEQQVTQRSTPAVVSAKGGEINVEGAPAVSGNVYADRVAGVRAGGYVEPTPDAAKDAVASAVVRVSRQPYPRSRKTNRASTMNAITPATATMLDRFAAANMAASETAEMKKAISLYQRGFKTSKDLSVVTPPNYVSRAAVLSGGTLTGFSTGEVSGAMPPENAPAEAANKAQGYMKGKFSDPIQATFEESAVSQPASTVTGVRFSANVQPGFVSAVGFGAAETAFIDTIANYEASRVSALTDPNGIVTNGTRERQATASAAAGEAVKPVADAPTGGVVKLVKPSEGVQTPQQEVKRGAATSVVTDAAEAAPADSTVGDFVKMDPVKTVAVGGEQLKSPPKSMMDSVQTVATAREEHPDTSTEVKTKRAHRKKK